jgi:hypothetical protein
MNIKTELANIAPGQPPKPIGLTNIGNLDEHFMPSSVMVEQEMTGAEPKPNENRCVLVNGVWFNRHGGLYTKMVEWDLYRLTKELAHYFPEHTHFDCGVFPHGDQAGHMVLFDLPHHGGRYHARRTLMEKRLPTLAVGEERFEHFVSILPRVKGAKACDELYTKLYRMNQRNNSFLYEGVVLKADSHEYSFTRTESQAKNAGWQKVRFK